MIIIDTSVAVKWAIAESHQADALALLDIDEARCAPDLLLPELAYVLRKKVLRAEIGHALATAALDGVKTAIDVFVPSAEISAEAFALATRLNHSCYDCFFLATAIGGGILATADEVFARKCVEGGLGAFVFLLGEDMTPLLAAIQSASLQPQGATNDVQRLSVLVQDIFASLRTEASNANPTKLSLPTSLLSPRIDPKAYVAIQQYLSALSPENLSATLAVCWLGRSCYRLEDWPRLFAGALQMTQQGFDSDGAYMMSAIQNLSKGVEKLEQILLR